MLEEKYISDLESDFLIIIFTIIAMPFLYMTTNEKNKV